MIVIRLWPNRSHGSGPTMERMDNRTERAYGRVV